MTRIILAEDHHLVRKGIRSLLEEEETFRVVGEASDGLEAAELTERLQPDILLLDLALPRLSGVEVIKRLKPLKKTRILVLTMHADTFNFRSALAAGANGYVLKDCKLEELVSAVNGVMRGEEVYSPKLRQNALESFLRPEKHFAETCTHLSPRETEVLKQAAIGLSNKAIGENLFISGRTVESHRSSIMKKLKLATQTDLVRFAIRENIIPA